MIAIPKYITANIGNVEVYCTKAFFDKLLKKLNYMCKKKYDARRAYLKKREAR